MHNAIVRKRLRSRRNGYRNEGGGLLRVLLIALVSMAALGAIGIAASLGTVYAVYQSYAEDYVPIEERLRQTAIGLTGVYDRGGPEDGEFLGYLPNPDAQLLDPVPFEDISPWMVEATIATEDNSFWDHPGVNIRGLVRAAYENYIINEFGEGTGGSSITQQLIKNVYICPQIGDEAERCEEAERTVDRKLQEIAFAMELERDYSKEEILGWYLNQISYASQYIGVGAAADGYFHKEASELTIAESALLAGIPSAPTRYHPRLNCVTEEGTDNCVVDAQDRTTVGGDAKQRQEDVIDLMVETGRITAQQGADAKAEELKVYQGTNDVKASHFVSNQVAPYLERLCEAGELPKIEAATDCYQSVHGAGYEVITTLDWELTQDATQTAQEYIAQGLDAGCNCYNASIVTIDPSTGELIVYVPNIDPSGASTDPRVRPDIDQATEVNQPGSSFKPAVYLAWMDVLNKAPMSTFWDTHPLTLDGGVSIDNPRGAPYTEGLITARAGLGGSQNVPSFRAAQESGVDNVIDVAKNLGLTTLQQNFDPTFFAHETVGYGPSIATGGANIRVVDMAYMNATFANMGTMVGVPHHARTIDPAELESLRDAEGAAYERGRQQLYDFNHGHTRLPGTRELDPVTILEVRDSDGQVIWQHNEPERQQVMNPGSIWLLHSIMSDCTARYIIWGCGGSNDGGGLDPYMPDGSKIPGGLKTGTQQGPQSAAETLETWMNGYSRHAATAVWIGNANNELVNDGPAHGYAAANTTKYLYRNWMSEYHVALQERGVIDAPAEFDSLRPENVAQVAFNTPATTRGLSGGCDQYATSWIRTDVSYESECTSAEIDTRNGLLASSSTPARFRETRQFVELPDYKPELAIRLARNFGGGRIPIVPTESSQGQPAVNISSPSNGATITSDTSVVGSVGSANVVDWTLQFGQGSNPGSWQEIGAGSGEVNGGVLGNISVEGLEPGVYTLQLVVTDATVGTLETSVTINIGTSDEDEDDEDGDDGDDGDGDGGDDGGGDDDDDGNDGGGNGDGGDNGGGDNGNGNGNGGDNGGGNGNGNGNGGGNNTGGGTGSGGTVSHPIGYEECGGSPDCGARSPVIVRCGPNGWFVDLPGVRQDWSSYGWPRYPVYDTAEAPNACS